MNKHDKESHANKRFTLKVLAGKIVKDKLKCSERSSVALPEHTDNLTYDECGRFYIGKMSYIRSQTRISTNYKNGNKL